MYVPEAFRIEDQDEIIRLLRAYPFATLVSVDSSGVPVATHIPLLVSGDSQLVLSGHVARANPHTALFATESLAIIHGPHAYVSPSTYVTKPNVPTWNYVAIHAYGVPRVISDLDTVVAHLQEMVKALDPTLSQSNPESVDPDMLRKKAAGIVAFEMVVTRIDAKAKLNQNKADSDRLAVRARLAESHDPQERVMAEMM